MQGGMQPSTNPHAGATRPERTGPAVRCQELTKTFGHGKALDGLSLELATGSVLALLGPNGAGKTTTVRLLNGVLRADSGSIDVLGFDPVTHGDELRRHTGVLTENAGLDDRLTARENLEVTGRIRGLRGQSLAARVTELLERFGMAPVADQRCQGFSTGQRRRVALARALVSDPELLFLDEPTSGLDPAATADVLELIATLTRQRGRTVVLCTHFLAEAGQLADEMAILDRGQLVTAGRPTDLAASLWPGIEVDLDIGEPADGPTVARLHRLPGVSAVAVTAIGATVTIGARADIPRIVAALTANGVPVFGATTRTRTLEDVYFAYQSRLGESTSGLGGLGALGSLLDTATAA